jgi:hypothetical protein
VILRLRDALRPDSIRCLTLPDIAYHSARGTAGRMNDAHPALVDCSRSASLAFASLAIVLTCVAVYRISDDGNTSAQVNPAKGSRNYNNEHPLHTVGNSKG